MPDVGWVRTSRSSIKLDSSYLSYQTIAYSSLSTLRRKISLFDGHGYFFNCQLRNCVSDEIIRATSIAFGERTDPIYLSCAEGNIPTTFDNRHRRPVGVHFDRFELTSDGRANCNHRILINIGYGLRYFVFTSILYDENEYSNSRSVNIVEQLLQPGVEIYRLAMPPGAYYLARTDLFAHDGTSPKLLRDHTVTMRISRNGS